MGALNAYAAVRVGLQQHSTALCSPFVTCRPHACRHQQQCKQSTDSGATPFYVVVLLPLLCLGLVHSTAEGHSAQSVDLLCLALHAILAHRCWSVMPLPVPLQCRHCSRFLIMLLDLSPMHKLHHWHTCPRTGMHYKQTTAAGSPPLSCPSILACLTTMHKHPHWHICSK
jgi:hypothetical protein